MLNECYRQTLDSKDFTPRCDKRLRKLIVPLLQVVYWASSLSPATQASILSCPYNVSILGVGRDWPYNGVKLKLTIDYIRQVES